MVPWHQRTRRRVAVALFCLLGLLPTAMLLAYGLGRNLPGAVRREATRLSTHLGLPVSIEKVEHPRPGTIVYHGLRVQDPETQRILLECDQLEAQWPVFSVSSAERGRDELVLNVSRAGLDRTELSWISRLLEQGLKGRPGWPKTSVHATVAELTLQSGALSGNSPGNSSENVSENSSENLSWAFRDVEALFQNDSAQSAIEIGFHPADSNSADRVHLQMVRNRQADPPSNQLILDTGPHVVPCGALNLGISSWDDRGGMGGFDGLGPRCQFRGRVWVYETPKGWNAEISGNILDIDLQKLLTRFGHQVAGTAHLRIDNAQIRDRRLVKATGRVEAGPGEIGCLFADTASRQLEMTRGTGFSTHEDPLAFDQFDVRFSLTPDGLLYLRGECSSANASMATGTSEGTGVVATGRYGPLFLTRSNHAVPTLSLTSALALPDDRPLPTTQRTAWLVDRLPLTE